MGFTAVIAALTGAVAATSVIGSQQQAKESKKAAAEAEAKNNAAIQSVKDAQAQASTKASDSIKRRVSTQSQTVYTSPLGLTGEAETSRKVLLGQ